MKRYIILLFFLNCMLVSAQESQYEIMKMLLNENSLPLVNMTVDYKTINRFDYVPGEIEITDYLCRTDSSTSTVKFHCKYRIRGVSSTYYKKKSFAVKLYDEFDKDLDANVFGIREENSWILDALSCDRTRMRNRICFDIWNDFSKTPYNTKYDNRNGTKGVFVELFINGVYNGIYCFTDKIDRKLLGLKKAKVDSDNKVSIHGLLYKGNNWESGSDLLSYKSVQNTNSDTWNAWELQYPDDYPSIDTWQPLMDLIDFCSDVTSDLSFDRDYREWFYTENLVDYVVFTLALNVRDNAYKNTFLSVVDINQGHKYMISPWDMDTSFGGGWRGEYKEKLADINRYNQIAPFNRLIVQNMSGFVDKIITKWKNYYQTLFSIESVSQRLDNYAEQFISSGAWEREYARWNDQPLPLKEDLTEEIAYVKDWYAKNYSNLCAQFGVEIPSGIVNIPSETHSNNAIYTLDSRRVNESTLSKGIYIVNGKKKVIR